MERQQKKEKDGERKALHLLREDDGGGAEAAQRGEEPAEIKLGRTCHRRGVRKVRAGEGNYGAAEEREVRKRQRQSGKNYCGAASAGRQS